MTTFVSTYLRVSGDRGGGRAQGEPGAEARGGHHHGEPRGAAAALPPDSRTHRGREQLHHHLPCISTHYLQYLHSLTIYTVYAQYLPSICTVSKVKY